MADPVGTDAEAIETFYRAFAARDHKTMQSLYADGATFGDPVFPALNADEVRAMWEMFCLRGTDLDVTWSGVSAQGGKGQARWEARYTFGATGRKVHNIITAEFELEGGKIVKHRDDFDFYRWSRMALGPPGLLLGWTPFLKKKVQGQARGQLERFVQERDAPGA